MSVRMEFSEHGYRVYWGDGPLDYELAKTYQGAKCIARRIKRRRRNIRLWNCSR